MVVRVDVNPALLAWARDRSKVSPSHLAEKFPKLGLWERREAQPTMKQLEEYARATYTPFGYLLLDRPPSEPIPIPDFRTIADTPVGRPSADLLDTIYTCEERQDWYRDFARANREDPVSFVGSLSMTMSIVDAARSVRDLFGLGMEERQRLRTSSDALTAFVQHADDAGVLVMVSGVVGSNTHRKLDPEEFRGFSLVDELAPVVFVNGADTKAAQVFTLIHELAHIGIGQPGLDDVDPDATASDATERWCNQLAAELLMPMDVVRDEFVPNAPLLEESERLAAIFKVSTLAILRRLLEASFLTQSAFRDAFTHERERIRQIMAAGGGGSGGNFYNTTPVRTSKRFARAVIMSTHEGNTLYRDAARLLGFKKVLTLDELGHRLGVN